MIPLVRVGALEHVCNNVVHSAEAVMPNAPSVVAVHAKEAVQQLVVGAVEAVTAPVVARV